MATPDGTNKINEGGISFAVVLTGQTTSGNPTVWNIDFGDGTQLNNIEGPGDGTATTTIYHAYANTDEEGDDHSVTAQVTELSGSNSIFPVTTVLETVDAPLTAYGLTVSLTSGVFFSGNIADFTDADPQGTASDYTASIDFGDGSQGSGTVVSDGEGGFFVQAAHAYTDEGLYGVGVTIYDAATQTIANAVANVVNPGISTAVTKLDLYQDEEGVVTFKVVDRNGNPLQGWTITRLDSNQANVVTKPLSGVTDADGVFSVLFAGGRQPTPPNQDAAVLFAPQPPALPLPSTPNVATVNMTVNQVIWHVGQPTSNFLSLTQGPQITSVTITATDAAGNPVPFTLTIDCLLLGGGAADVQSDPTPPYNVDKGSVTISLQITNAPPANTDVTWSLVGVGGDLNTSFDILVDQ